MRIANVFSGFSDSLSLFLRLVRGELWSCFLPDAKICPARSTLHLSRSSTEKGLQEVGTKIRALLHPSYSLLSECSLSHN